MTKEWKQRFHTFEQMLDAGAERYPDKAALSDPIKNLHVPYRELRAAAKNLSLYINEALGHDRRGVVSVFGDNCPHWMLAFVATVLGGNVVAPLNCLTKEPEEVRRLLLLADAELVIAGRKYQRLLDEALDGTDGTPWPEGTKKPAVLWLEEIDPHTGAYGGAAGRYAGGKPAIPPDEFAILLFTSGSIQSKGVMLSQAGLLANQQQAAELLLVAHADEVFVAALPLSHAYGLLCGFVPLTFGATAVYAPAPKDLAEYLAAAKEAFPGVKLLAASVPELARIIGQKIAQTARGTGRGKTGMQRLLQRARYAAFKAMRAANYRLTTCFGADLSGVFFGAVKRRFGEELKLPIGGGPVDDATELALRGVGILAIQGYGATEMGPLVAANEPRWKTVLCGSVGWPPPGAEVAIFGGEVCARGPSMMLGYYKNEAATKRALPGDGWYHTGDRGYYARRTFSGKIAPIGESASEGRIVTRADGLFLVLEGRVDNQFANRRGENIFPEVIETLMLHSPLVRSCRVVESPATQVCAQVFPDEDALAARLGGRKPTPEETQRLIAALVRHVNTKLQAGCGIDRFEIQNEDFERNAAGKFKRRKGAPAEGQG